MSRSRRRGLIAAAVLALVAVGFLGFVAGRVQSPAQVVADAAPPPPSLVTATVRDGPLTDEIRARGLPSARAASELVGPWDGMTVTGVHVGPDDQVDEGTLLAEINGRPVVAVAGEFPLYRDITGGTEGRDVAQVQAALERLGHAVEIDGEFGPATQQAWAAFLDGVGYEPTPGVEDASAARRAADEAVASARAALANLQAPPAPSAPGSQEAAAQSDKSEIEAARRALASAQMARDDVYLATGPMIPQAELAVLSDLPRVVDMIAVEVGQSFTASTTLLSFQGYGGTLTVEVPSAVLDAARPDLNAVVELPDGEQIRLTPLDASEATTTGSDEPEGRVGTRSLALVPADAGVELPGAEVGSLLVTLTLADDDDREGLVVPAAALWTTPEGTTAVTRVTERQASTGVGGTTVPVSVQRTLGGMARLDVTGELQPGDLVVIAPSAESDDG